MVIIIIAFTSCGEINMTLSAQGRAIDPRTPEQFWGWILFWD